MKIATSNCPPVAPEEELPFCLLCLITIYGSCLFCVVIYFAAKHCGAIDLSLRAVSQKRMERRLIMRVCSSAIALDKLVFA